MKKHLLLYLLTLILTTNCAESNPEISVVITFDQYFTLTGMSGTVPFWGITDIDYTIGNTGNVDIKDYSIIIECVNSQSEAGSVTVSGVNLNVGANKEGQIELGIIDPSSSNNDCYLKSQTLDGTTTDFN
jgi:hypothetical protein